MENDRNCRPALAEASHPSALCGICVPLPHELRTLPNPYFNVGFTTLLFSKAFCFTGGQAQPLG